MGREVLPTKFYLIQLLLPISPHKQYIMFYGTCLFQIGFSSATVTALFSDLEFIFVDPVVASNPESTNINTLEQNDFLIACSLLRTTANIIYFNDQS